ncbi:acyltransferase [uncultured Dialister sp.]|uniref:acyltransferase n=1 Tax=uncultured Dialister sp. TaxID=278064 RepID=UPI0025D3E353|nr:acyltransferase [uncultured Dialister sp.]
MLDKFGKTRKNGRIEWLDTVRALAILMVLLVHSTENLYSMIPIKLNNMSLISSSFAVTAFTIGRLGVPLFLFLSGYLLLDRYYDAKGCINFWKKNWLGMLMTTEIWIVLYDIFLPAAHFTHWNNLSFIEDVLLIRQVRMGHMWYMPMIIGLYICIPFAARALNNLNSKILRFPIGLLSVYAFGLPVLSLIRRIMGRPDVPWGPALDLGFAGGMYGLYIILGWCMKKGMLKQFSTSALAIAGFVSFIFTVVFQMAAHWKGVNYNVWYNYGFLVICTLCIFELFSRRGHYPFQKAWNWLSRNSFGIYLIHFPFCMLISRKLTAVHMLMPLKVILLWCCILAISVIICLVVDRFPKISRILLYNR